MDEILATLACDAELSHEMAECKKANLAHTKAMETLSAKQKEHRAVVLLRDKVNNSFVLTGFLNDHESQVYASVVLLEL